MERRISRTAVNQSTPATLSQQGFAAFLHQMLRISFFWKIATFSKWCRWRWWTIAAIFYDLWFKLEARIPGKWTSCWYDLRKGFPFFRQYRPGFSSNQYLDQCIYSFSGKDRHVRPEANRDPLRIYKSISRSESSRKYFCISFEQFSGDNLGWMGMTEPPPGSSWFQEGESSGE